MTSEAAEAGAAVTLFDEIRSACALAEQRAEQVAIVGDPGGLARSLAADPLLAPSYDLEHHFHAADPEALAAFVITLDTVNFGSGYFSALIKRPGMSGYFTVASRLKDHFERQGPLAAVTLAGLQPSEVAAIFGQDLKHPLRSELMARFTEALNDLGRYLLDRFGGAFTALVRAADGSAEQLVRLLAAMPLFRDRAFYQDLPALFGVASVTGLISSEGQETPVRIAFFAHCRA